MKTKASNWIITRMSSFFNTRLQMTQQDQAIRSLEKQMEDDNEIIRLRTNIRKAAEAKVANGTLTVTEDASGTD